MQYLPSPVLTVHVCACDWVWCQALRLAMLTARERVDTVRREKAKKAVLSDLVVEALSEN